MNSRRSAWIAMAMSLPSILFFFDGSASSQLQADAFTSARPLVNTIVHNRARRSSFIGSAAFPKNNISRSTKLFAAEGESDDGPGILEEGDASEAPNPPPLLALGYKLAACINAIAGVILLCNIKNIATTDATAAMMSSAAQASTRYHPNLLATYTAGSLGYIFFAAGTCSLLSKSVTTNRLHASDTYKRLTMGTLIFGVLGLCSLPGEAGCLLLSSSSSSTPYAGVGSLLVLQLAKFVTAFASFVGWEYGSGGFGNGVGPWQRSKNILSEIGRGCRRAWKTMPVTDERPATFYRTFMIFVCLGSLIFNGPELVFNLQQGGGAGLFSLPVSLTLSSIARLGLLSVLLYVLKDAAERKRLEGTTFISVNMMVGLWACGVGIAQGLADGPIMSFSIRQAADKFLFALPFLTNGIISYLSKMGIIEKRDEEDPDADPPLRVPLF